VLRKVETTNNPLPLREHFPVTLLSYNPPTHSVGSILFNPPTHSSLLACSSCMLPLQPYMSTRTGEYRHFKTF